MSAVIVHCIDDVRRVASLAKEADSFVTLTSAKLAAQSLGPEVFAEMIAQGVPDDARAFIRDWYIDCGDDAGLALRALRAGCKGILLSDTVAAFDRVKDIAAQHGAKLSTPHDDALDLREGMITDKEIKHWMNSNDG